MDVDMIVRHRAMVVLAWRDVQAAAKRPEPDRNQRDPDNAFSPGGQDVDRWKQIAEDNGEKRHDDDT